MLDPGAAQVFSKSVRKSNLPLKKRFSKLEFVITLGAFDLDISAGMLLDRAFQVVGRGGYQGCAYSIVYSASLAYSADTIAPVLDCICVYFESAPLYVGGDAATGTSDTPNFHPVFSPKVDI